MSLVYVFLAEGFEEVEALTVVDILRRKDVDVRMVSVSETCDVTGSHDINVLADMTFDEIEEEADAIVLPGGIPGTPNLKAHKGLEALIRDYHKKKKLLTAICAAPTIYGEMRLLVGKYACCYPGMEDGLLDAHVTTDAVTEDGIFITSRGLGTAIEFALAILARLTDKETADNLATKIVYNK